MTLRSNSWKQVDKRRTLRKTNTHTESEPPSNFSENLIFLSFQTADLELSIWTGVAVFDSCRSRKFNKLKNKSLLATIGIDTAETWPVEPRTIHYLPPMVTPSAPVTKSKKSLTSPSLSKIHGDGRISGAGFRTASLSWETMKRKSAQHVDCSARTPTPSEKRGCAMCTGRSGMPISAASFRPASMGLPAIANFRELEPSHHCCVCSDSSLTELRVCKMV